MSDSSQTTTGWIIFITAMGSMFGLIGMDMMRLMDLSEAKNPAFIGGIFVHLSSVIAAFVGGKLIPSDRTRDGRVTDSKIIELNKQ